MVGLFVLWILRQSPYRPGWSQTHYVAKDDLEFIILLSPLPPHGSDYHTWFYAMNAWVSNTGLYAYQTISLSAEVCSSKLFSKRKENEQSIMVYSCNASILTQETVAGGHIYTSFSQNYKKEGWGWVEERREGGGKQ